MISGLPNIVASSWPHSSDRFIAAKTEECLNDGGLCAPCFITATNVLYMQPPNNFQTPCFAAMSWEVLCYAIGGAEKINVEPMPIHFECDHLFMPLWNKCAQHVIWPSTEYAIFMCITMWAIWIFINSIDGWRWRCMCSTSRGCSLFRLQCGVLCTQFMAFTLRSVWGASKLARRIAPASVRHRNARQPTPFKWNIHRDY